MKPKHASDEHQRDVVRTALHDAVAAPADGKGRSHAGDTRAYVHHGPSGEILVRETHVGESGADESASPDHVRHRGVDQERPNREERQYGRVSDPLRGGPEHDARRDDREGPLEQEELGGGYHLNTVADTGIDALPQNVVEIPYDSPVTAVTERERISDRPPYDTD